MIRRPPEPDSRVRGVALKVLVSLVTGTFVFAITALTDVAHDAQVSGLTLSVFIAGALLVTQFLVEFEHRFVVFEDRIEDRIEAFEERIAAAEAAQDGHSAEIEKLVTAGFTKINEATELFGLVEASALRTDAVIQLVRHSTQIDPTCPGLIHRFAQSEIGRMSEFLKELSEGGNVTYEGEDRDWMLALTRTCESSVDATSLTTVDAGGKGFVDGGLWTSDLGQRYLDVQRDAIQRDVRIRRVFILDRPELASDPDFLAVCELQREMGIEVRILDSSSIPSTRRSSLFDFVLFDEVISYEVTPASRIENTVRPTIVNTRLELRAARVRDRIQRFRDLWASARVFEQPQDQPAKT